MARRAAEEWGVLSIDELRACGLSDRAVLTRARGGRLHRIHRGVYAVGHANPPLEGRLLAAVKACGPGAALSHFSAAALWGIVDWDERHPEVTVATGNRRHAGVRVHQSRHLSWPDVRRHRGMPVTSPARTLADLAATLPPPRLRRAVRQAQSLRLAGVREILEVVDRLRPRRGAAELARVVASGPAPTRSDLEDVVLDLILRGGFEHPEVNVALDVAGRRVVPDFRWRAQRLVVEADGAAWHDHRLAREDDAERQALLEASGERVVRVTWQQAIARPSQTLARLRAAGAPVRDACAGCAGGTAAAAAVPGRRCRGNASAPRDSEPAPRPPYAYSMTARAGRPGAGARFLMGVSEPAPEDAWSRRSGGIDPRGSAAVSS